MQVIVVEPKKKPMVQDVGSDLESMQKIVGGSIEAIYPFEEPVALICNEEGKLNGMAPNRWLEEDIICGPFFLVGDDHEGGFCSLTDDQIQKYTAQFQEPELFTGHEPELKPRMDIFFMEGL